MNLRELDQVWVPRMARAVGGWAQGLLVRRDRAQELARSVDAESLHRLDQRLTRRGPLAVVREVPQLGFAVIALLVFVSCVTAGKFEADQQRQQNASSSTPELTPGEQVQPSDEASLGPKVGGTTGEYEAEAAQSLDAAAKDAPDARRVALVSLNRYLTPAQTVTLFAGYDVKRVFLRARAAGKEAAQLPIEVKAELGAELAKAYETTAKARKEAQKAYQGYVDTIDVTTQEEQLFKDQYVAFATSTGIEAKAYGSGCACVFAVVVESGAQGLLRLEGKPSVRAVEAAKKGLALGALQVRPLLPEVKGVVAKQQAATDAQP